MKRMIIFCALILISCTSDTREMSSGADAKRDMNVQNMEEMSDAVDNQYPTTSPGTERNQPF